MKKKETDAAIDETMLHIEKHLDRLGIAKIQAARRTIWLACQAIFLTGKHIGIMQERSMWEKNYDKALREIFAKVDAMKNDVILRHATPKGKA